jgi:DNA-directed RNA polymerase specialized sigma24 family protein
MIVPKRKRKPPLKTKASRFDRLVARYYPAVYSFASRFTDNPREAVALTRHVFKSSQKQLQTRRAEDALAPMLVSAVIRAGLAAG